MADAVRLHWLAGVVRRAGLPNGEHLAIAVQTSVAEAWAEACRACPVTEEELAKRVAAHFRLRVASLEQAELRALKLVPEAVARRYGILPLRENDRQLVVATSNPVDIEAEQALGFASARTPVFEVAPPTALREAIDTRYSPERVVETLLGSVDAGAADAVQVVEEIAPEAVAARDLEAAPVVKLTNVILQNAVAERASDIHIEPGRAGAVVRFRVDGVLRHQMQMPMPAMNRVVSRIKILGKLDIADRLRPQDGRARIEVHGRAYDLRISTVPTRESEKVVIRILDPEGSLRLEDLRVAGPELQRIRSLLAHRGGIFVVTGPTGSGKTTTLYAAIRELATGEINIMTVEDPVEYELSGVTQIQVEPKRRVTFPSALRAILRQDLDVVFVGEIRDLETAEVAVQASLTGHLVLATLHTNDAVGIVPRLVDLGLERASIAGSLRGAVAQRLVRRVCEHCARPIDGELTEVEAHLAQTYGVTPTVRTVGCKRCGSTGYRGRLPVNEVLVSTGAIQEMIVKGATVRELQRAAVTGGMRSMLEVALERVRDGSTSLQEVERVLGEAVDEGAAPPSDQPPVLLVDDDPTVRRLARALLEKNGFRVSEVGDGPAALERLASPEEYALMVLDLDLPTMTGLDVLRRVRKSVRTAALPVVVLTGSEEGAAEVEVMDAGADDYIRKPIDPPRFVARIKAAVRRASS